MTTNDRPDATAAPETPTRASLMDRLVIVGFLAMLVIPGVAALLGFRPEALEARNATALPPFSVATALDGATYAGIDRAIADRFPFRSVAVRTHALIDFGLLGGSTNRDVIVGRDRWLFSREERDAGCPKTADEWLAGWDRAVEAADAADVELRFVFVPDKHTVYPDRTPAGTGLGEACTDEQRVAMRAGLADRPETTIDVLDDLVAARADEAERPLYYRSDTHWTPFGSLFAIRALVSSLDPAVWDEAAVSVGDPVTRETDLSRLLGLPMPEVLPEVRVRADVEVTQENVPTDVDLDNAPAVPRYRVPDDVPAIEGRTLILYDSYFGNDQARIRPWFRDSTWIHIGDLSKHPELVDDLPAFDRVVIERVERFAYNYDPAELLAPVLEAARD